NHLYSTHPEPLPLAPLDYFIYKMLAVGILEMNEHLAYKFFIDSMREHGAFGTQNKDVQFVFSKRSLGIRKLSQSDPFTSSYVKVLGLFNPTFRVVRCFWADLV